MKHYIDLHAFDPRLTQAVQRIAETVSRMPIDERFGVASRVLLVGGCVRDALIQSSTTDLDLEIFGVAPERLETLLENLYPGRINRVGKTFGILKVHLSDDIGLDIAIPRKDSKNGKGHTGFLIDCDPTMSIQEAARRRDFTVNAIFADPLTGDIIDPFHGIDDLARQRLAVVDPERFQDDPLRVYRAIQLAARFALAIDPKTNTLLRQMVEQNKLDELPMERITEEWKKLLLKSQKPSIGFERMRELGIIERYFPECHALINTPQEPEWHPEGDVWIHTMMVIDQAARLSQQPERVFTSQERLAVIFGALCHDFGKPSTTRMLEGRVRSIGHEDAGKEPTESFCKRFTFGEDITSSAMAIAMNHLKPGMFFRAKEKGNLTDAQYTNAVRTLLKRIHPISWRVLLCASEADWRGRGTLGVGTDPYLAGELLARTIHEKQLDAAPTHTLLRGEDILALGVSPGPSVGKIIQNIEELRDANVITDRKEALEYARRNLHKTD